MFLLRSSLITLPSSSRIPVSASSSRSLTKSRSRSSSHNPLNRFSSSSATLLTKTSPVLTVSSSEISPRLPRRSQSTVKDGSEVTPPSCSSRSQSQAKSTPSTMTGRFTRPGYLRKSRKSLISSSPRIPCTSWMRIKANSQRSESTAPSSSRALNSFPS